MIWLECLVLFNSGVIEFLYLLLGLMIIDADALTFTCNVLLMIKLCDERYGLTVSKHQL